MKLQIDKKSESQKQDNLSNISEKMNKNEIKVRNDIDLDDDDTSINISKKNY